ncbi:MAG: coproporphyrinogen III oxidase, partial [Sulfurovum sp.]|nr:coproporphyrinogen III oxidase [Sulfurovum sp.]
MKTFTQSEETKEVHLLFSGLQVYFVSKLNALALQFGEGKSTKSVSWDCDKGKHGEGKHYEARDKSLFNQASVAVSHIHYEDNKNKVLEYLLAFSSTIHPENPHVPSLHLSMSREKLKGHKACWKLVADFNPSILNEASLDQNIFLHTLEKSAGNFYEEGIDKGNSYFYIDEVDRYRGVSHYYLEDYRGRNFEEEKLFILALYESLIECYLDIVSAKLRLHPSYTLEKKEEQLAYHTLYLFQVLIQDRDTRVALLECDKNDLGVLASLPSEINRDILSLWGEKMTDTQNLLLKKILKVLPKVVPTPIDDKCKKKLANTLRKHYKNTL